MLLIEPNSAAMLLRVQHFVVRLLEYWIAVPAIALFLLAKLCRAGKLESSEIPETKPVPSNLLLWPTDRMETYSRDYYQSFLEEGEVLELTTH
jgi:hypothetical protein